MVGQPHGGPLSHPDLHHKYSLFKNDDEILKFNYDTKENVLSGVKH